MNLFWRCYIAYHADLYFLVAQYLSRHISSSLDALAGSSPFGLFLSPIHCLLHRLIFFGVNYLLEPSALFYFSWTRITRSFSCLPFGRPGVYCIFYTLTVFWAGCGCQFRALLYLSQFNPCGYVYCSSSTNCGLFTVTSVTFNSIFEHHCFVTRISF